MSTQVQTLKGFRDYVGPDAQKRAWLIAKIRGVFERFGYEPLETPAIEYQSLLMGKYGAEADKLIYTFEDQGERQVALRYDQTVPTARVIAQYQQQLTFPFKRYQIQPVWRAEKPQKGRYREFLQCDADIIGSTSSNADAEIVSVYAAIYRDIGIDSFRLKINDRSLLINTIKEAGVADELVFPVIQTIDKLDKKTREEVIEELLGKGLAKEVSTKLLDTLQSLEMPASLKQIVEAAVAMGTPVETFEFTPTLARGLDYYTGLIFEGVIPEYTVGSVGGGGRYDNLIEQLVGVKQPAVGFGLGFDRTLEAAEELGKVPTFTATAKVLVTVFSPELVSKSLEITTQLRQKRLNVECYLDANKKLEAQLKYANKKGIEYVVIIGPEEIEKGVLKLKNMKTGEQRETLLADINL